MESWRAFGSFVAALLHHWVALLTGGVILAAVGAWEHQTGASVSWSIYVTIAVVTFVFSCFLAFRDQYIRASGLQIDLSNAISTTTHMRFATESFDKIKQEYSENKLELENLKAVVGEPFPFTVAQKRSLVRMMSEIPMQRRFQIDVVHPGFGGSAAPARRFAKMLQEAGWDASTHGDPTIDTDFRGIVLMMSENVTVRHAPMPSEALIFASAFNEVGIAFEKGINSGAENDDFFWLIVAEP